MRSSEVKKAKRGSSQHEYVLQSFYGGNLRQTSIRIQWMDIPQLGQQLAKRASQRRVPGPKPRYKVLDLALNVGKPGVELQIFARTNHRGRIRKFGRSFGLLTSMYVQLSITGTLTKLQDCRQTNGIGSVHSII